MEELELATDVAQEALTAAEARETDKARRCALTAVERSSAARRAAAERVDTAIGFFGGVDMGCRFLREFAENARAGESTGAAISRLAREALARAGAAQVACAYRGELPSFGRPGGHYGR